MKRKLAALFVAAAAVLGIGLAQPASAGTSWAGFQSGTSWASLQNGTSWAGLVDGTSWASLMGGSSYSAVAQAKQANAASGWYRTTSVGCGFVVVEHKYYDPSMYDPKDRNRVDVLVESSGGSRKFVWSIMDPVYGWSAARVDYTAQLIDTMNPPATQIALILPSPCGWVNVNL